MRNAKPMKLSSTGIWKLFWIVLLCLPGWKEMHAQDPLPEQPTHDKNSGPVYSSSEMQKLMFCGGRRSHAGIVQEYTGEPD